LQRIAHHVDTLSVSTINIIDSLSIDINKTLVTVCSDSPLL